MPLRTASTPTPAGPPHLCALAVSTDQPGGIGSRPADWAASTTSGTPAARHASAASATGWSVPTSWLAVWSAATATPSAATALGELRQVDAPGERDADRLDGPAAPLVDPGGVEHARMLDRAHHQVPPGPPAALRERPAGPGGRPASPTR